MSDSKISALPTKAVPISADILPIVDSTVTDNKKITIGSLPISTATQTALNTKMTGNAAIVAATKTKITYDTKGLVTSGADATTADIADSTNKRYVTDAQLTVISNTSGTNTGDQDLSTLALKATTISTTAPLTGGGDLSANRTLSIPAATTLVDGYLAATDWTTFNNKEPSIAAGTTAQYWRGDKSWQTLDKAAVGLGNVDNTSDANKPVSTATQTALNLKVDKAGDTMTGALDIDVTLAGTTPLLFIKNISPNGIASLLTTNDLSNFLSFGVTGSTITGLPLPNDEAFLFSSNAINAATTLAGGFKWHQDGTQVASIINAVFTADSIDASPVNFTGLTQVTPTISDFVPFTDGSVNYKASLNEMPVSAPQNLNSIVNALIFG